MKKTIILAFSIFLFVVAAFAQETSVLYIEIQQAKKTNIQFENAVLSDATPDVEALKHFENPEDVFFLGNISIERLQLSKCRGICIGII